MIRATKIVATLGPASSDPEVLERMLRAGVDVVRLDFSHGSARDHIDREDSAFKHLFSFPMAPRTWHPMRRDGIQAWDRV